MIFLRACLHGGKGPQVGEVTCGGSPRLTCKRDHIKMRDYTDRRVTPPKLSGFPHLPGVPHLRVNSPLNYLVIVTELLNFYKALNDLAPSNTPNM